MSSSKLVKLVVCAECLSNDIVDINCICCHSNKYPVIDLEFEKCEHCGTISSSPAVSEFNNQQYKKLISERSKENY